MIAEIPTRTRPPKFNVLKGQEAHHIRTAKDEAVRLTSIRDPKRRCLEDDELVEVTPKSIRLRKKTLDPATAEGRAAEGSRGV